MNNTHENTIKRLEAASKQNSAAQDRYYRQIKRLEVSSAKINKQMLAADRLELQRIRETEA